MLPKLIYVSLLTLLLLVVFGNLFFISTPVLAQSCPGGNCPAAGVQQLQDLVGRIIALSSSFAALVIVIMFVYGGIRFLTSNGEPKNIQLAQQVITWAVIGVVALFLSWIILLAINQFSVLPAGTLTHICFRFEGC